MSNKFVLAEGMPSVFEGVTVGFLETALDITSEERVGPSGLLIQDEVLFSSTEEDAFRTVSIQEPFSTAVGTDFSERHNTADPLLERVEMSDGDRVLSTAQTLLDTFKRSPESNDVLALIFGGTASASRAQTVIQSLSDGRNWPKISVLPKAQLSAWGAYAAQSDTVYLAEELGEHPEILVQTLIEELGHFIDAQVNEIDSPGDEGALFAGFVVNGTVSDGAIAVLKAEDDTAALTLDGQTVHVEKSDEDPGVFTVAADGQITVEFLADGGGYKGQVAVFDLAGMEGFAPGSPAFIREAARRALSNSTEGYLVIDDQTEKAKFSGELGERDRNSGEVTNRQTFQFAPDTQIAVMLVPHGSVQKVFDNATTAGKLRPIFSLADANPEGRTHIGRIRSGVFAMEDVSFDRNSDGDFNDVIFQLTGATEQLESVTNLIENNRKWINTPLGQQLFQTPVDNEALDVPDSDSVPTEPEDIADAPPDASEDTTAPEVVPPENTDPSDIPPEVETEDTGPSDTDSDNTNSNTDTEGTGSSEADSADTDADADSPDSSTDVPQDSDSSDNSGQDADPGQDADSENFATQTSIRQDVAKFSSGDNESSIAGTNAARITLGTQTIYVGANQASANNQNPIIASFDDNNPDNNWIKSDYETTGTDGKGLGLAWSGENLYAIFSVDGTQGSPSEDFRRAANDAEQGWLRTYGAGGGSKVAVMGRIDPANGDLLDAAYLSAILESGNSNSLAITDVSVKNNGNLVITADSFFSPRRPDGSAMTRITTEGSPFIYTVEMTPDLKRVVATSAEGWV